MKDFGFITSGSRKGMLIFSAPRQPGFVDWTKNNRCQVCGEIYPAGMLAEHRKEKHTLKAVE